MKKLFAKLKHEHKGDDGQSSDSKPSSAPAKSAGKPLQQGANVDAGRVKEIAAMLGPV
jgi:hypothetical protein